MTHLDGLSLLRSENPPPPERLAIDGPLPPIDARTEAVRPDLADIALAGRVFAPHFVRPVEGVLVYEASLFPAPDGLAKPIKTLSRGTRVEVFEITAQWAWVKADGLMGYCPHTALGDF